MKLLQGSGGRIVLGMGLLLLASASPALAQDGASEVGYALDNAMLFLCAVLVLFMQAGFAMVEAGLNAAKNTVNILFKNAMDVSVGALLFFIIGFGLMYPGSYVEDADALNQYFAFGGLGIYGDDPMGQGTTEGFSPQVDWFFQAVFAATAATIVWCSRRPYAILWLPCLQCHPDRNHLSDQWLLEMGWRMAC